LKESDVWLLIEEPLPGTRVAAASKPNPAAMFQQTIFTERSLPCSRSAHFDRAAVGSRP